MAGQSLISGLNLTRDEFAAFATSRRRAGLSIAVPLQVRLLADQLTPVLAYRRLVAPDERTAPSFLLESVEGGDRQGRYSILSSRPVHQITGKGNYASDDPLDRVRKQSAAIRLEIPEPKSRRDTLPKAFLGGWVGYAAYDAVRYAEPEKLATPPMDDRNLPDVAFSFYDGVVIFDHVDKLVHVIQLAIVSPDEEAAIAFDRATAALERRVEEIQKHSKPLPAGVVGADAPAPALKSNMTREQHAQMLDRALEYIRAGDIFQVVLGQRFEKRTKADPFDVYRALRAVNPSPYMVYMQTGPCILVASSPEILCRVRREETERGRDEEKKDARSGFVVTNRPLAGTRKRGQTPEEDAALEADLLSDQKERAEHIMLVDLGRNDVGRVAEPGTIELPAVMDVERYSHVMHISSTVTGRVREGLDCWDALRAALPVGTISGAPKVRAMQIIDELEPIRRGPYGGGIGYVGLDGQMDIALALRTMVIPCDARNEEGWLYHLQAAGGIVADSKAEPEYQETVNKAAALGRAIALAEQAFASSRDIIQ
ncbi:MAG: anthranilate synthase component I [Phycisphaeraceae bacterium]|nr:anthranilate synthase component I [Phycisphaeraceae bacterium]